MRTLEKPDEKVEKAKKKKAPPEKSKAQSDLCCPICPTTYTAVCLTLNTFEALLMWK